VDPQPVWRPRKLEAIEFVKYLNSVVHEYHPGVVMLAEESTAWPGVTHALDKGGLGFDLKWNMGWMHDMLEYFSLDPVYRTYHQNNLTFALLYAFTERFILRFPMTRSCRQGVDARPDARRRLAEVCQPEIAARADVWIPGEEALFMGIDFGQWNEWNHEQSLDWHLLNFEPHRGLKRCVMDLNALYGPGRHSMASTLVTAALNGSIRGPRSLRDCLRT